MTLHYTATAELTPELFTELLRTSTLGERRPINDPQCIAGMVSNADLTVTAWDGERLVGAARSVTDFHTDCFLCDLAVDTRYQRLGIGRRLQRLTQEQLGPNCKLVLLAAPNADAYYERLGFTRHPRCWVLAPDETIRG